MIYHRSVFYIISFLLVQVGSLVRGMQNLVSLVAAGFAKEVLIYFLDVGAFV